MKFKNWLGFQLKTVVTFYVWHCSNDSGIWQYISWDTSQWRKFSLFKILTDHWHTLLWTNTKEINRNVLSTVNMIFPRAITFLYLTPEADRSSHSLINKSCFVKSWGNYITLMLLKYRYPQCILLLTQLSH